MNLGVFRGAAAGEIAVIGLGRSGRAVAGMPFTNCDIRLDSTSVRPDDHQVRASADHRVCERLGNDLGAYAAGITRGHRDARVHSCNFIAT